MAAQFLRPNRDITISSMQGFVDGVETPPIWDRLNDNPFPLESGSYGFTDFVGVTLPMASNMIIGLSPGQEPFAREGYPDGSSYESGHVLRIHSSTDVVIYLQYQLMEGSRVIASTGTLSPTLGTRPTPDLYEFVLTPAQAKDIRSYADLRFVLVDPGGNSPFFSAPGDPMWAQFVYTIESIEMEIPREARRRTSEAVYL